MLAFLCAFSIENFITKDHVPIYVTAITWLAFGSLILWCIYVTLENENIPLWQRIKEDVESRWSALRERNQEFMKKLLPALHTVPSAHSSPSQFMQASASLSAVPAAAPSTSRQTFDDEEDGKIGTTIDPSSAV